jgi:hypothetical protein
MRLPPYPFLNRCLFKCFPWFMNKFFAPKLDPYEDSVEVPEDVEGKDFDRPIDKRMWRKRFPELREPFPIISKRAKGWIPDDPLPGEFESPIWMIEKYISTIRFKVHCWRMDRRKQCIL